MIKRIACIAAVSLGVVTPVLAEWQPSRPVEFIVTAGAGGGTDVLARTVQMIVSKHKLMGQSIVVFNKGGGSGSEGFIEMKTGKGDPHRIAFGTSNEWMLPLVAHLPYTYDELTPVAALAADEFVLWVNKDSPYKSAKEYLDAVKSDASKFRMGGSQSKDVDEILTREIDRAHGTKFTYIPFKSGGEAATQLAGGHIASNVNNPSESIGQWKGGLVKPLCVFAPRRMTYTAKVASDMAWSDIPTCREQGVPINAFQMPRTVWLPGGVNQEHVDFYVKLLDKVRQTPEWKEYLERTSQSEIFSAGAPWKKYIEDDESRARKMFRDQGWLIQ